MADQPHDDHNPLSRMVFGNHVINAAYVDGKLVARGGDEQNAQGRYQRSLSRDEAQKILDDPANAQLRDEKIKQHVARHPEAAKTVHASRSPSEVVRSTAKPTAEAGAAASPVAADAAPPSSLPQGNSYHDAAARMRALKVETNQPSEQNNVLAGRVRHFQEKRTTNDRIVESIRSLESGGAREHGHNYDKNGQLILGRPTYLGHAFGSGQMMPPTYTKLSKDLVANGSPHKKEYMHDPRFNPEIGNPLIAEEMAEFKRMAAADPKKGHKLLREMEMLKPDAFRGADGKALRDNRGKLITDEHTARKRYRDATPVYTRGALRDVADISLEDLKMAKTINDVKPTRLKDEGLYERTVRASIHADQARFEKYTGTTPSFAERMRQAGRWWLGGKAPHDSSKVGSDGGVTGDKHYARILAKADNNIHGKPSSTISVTAPAPSPAKPPAAVAIPPVPPSDKALAFAPPLPPPRPADTPAARAIERVAPTQAKTKTAGAASNRKQYAVPRRAAQRMHFASDHNHHRHGHYAHDHHFDHHVHTHYAHRHHDHGRHETGHYATRKRDRHYGEQGQGRRNRAHHHYAWHGNLKSHGHDSPNKQVARNHRGHSRSPYAEAMDMPNPWSHLYNPWG